VENKEKEKNINASDDMEAFEITANGKSVVMFRYYNPDNPLINHPDIKIWGKKWDLGGNYAHQYEKPAETKANE
jgi:hypothetical protein